nr:unnamed protein product [Callosobruchus chinensis]
MVVLKGGRRIKLPAETRWCSYRDSFKSLIEKLAHMKEISAATRKKIKPKVTELIFNDDFIDDVQKHLEIQDPICNLVNICQSADTSLADAVNMWLKLEVPEVFADKLNSRQEMALNVYALTAYFLHPTYDNSKLKSAHNAKINAFLFRQLDNQGIEEWDKLNTRTGIFATLFDKKLNYFYITKKLTTYTKNLVVAQTEYKHPGPSNAKNGPPTAKDQVMAMDKDIPSTSQEGNLRVETPKFTRMIVQTAEFNFDEVIRETEERNSRKQNLIVYGLPENGVSKQEQEAQDDNKMSFCKSDFNVPGFSSNELTDRKSIAINNFVTTNNLFQLNNVKNNMSRR